MAKKKIKATKLTVNLPFKLGELEFEPDEIQQRVAWELYVELTTRIAIQPRNPGEGLIREALTSLYSIFDATREILRVAGPSVAKGPKSVGPVAIEVLNNGLRPFISKWHTLLLAHEQLRAPNINIRDHEYTWEKADEFRKELTELQEQMKIYSQALAEIAGITK
jgi:hypothetical protein